MNAKKKNLFFYLLCLQHLFLGINAVFGGLLLMIKPDGSLLGMQKNWLANSPFNNYFIPGFLLFTFLGLLSIFTFIGLVKKVSWKWPQTLNIYKNRYWAWTFSIYTSIISILWITIQLIMTQYFWIQPLIIFIGIGILICTLMPQVMNYHYQPKEN